MGAPLTEPAPPPKKDRLRGRCPSESSPGSRAPNPDSSHSNWTILWGQVRSNHSANVAVVNSGPSAAANVQLTAESDGDVNLSELVGLENAWFRDEQSADCGGGRSCTLDLGSFGRGDTRNVVLKFNSNADSISIVFQANASFPPDPDPTDNRLDFRQAASEGRDTSRLGRRLSTTETTDSGVAGPDPSPARRGDQQRRRAQFSTRFPRAAGTPFGARDFRRLCGLPKMPRCCPFIWKASRCASTALPRRSSS